MSFIVITACPYSATKYILHVLRQIGLDVGHERILENGTVSWQHCHLTVSDLIKSGCPENVVLLHQVRHPLMAISGLRVLHGRSKHPRDKKSIWGKFAERTKHMGIPWDIDEVKYGLRGAMNLWYWWNKVGSEKADGTYTVETLPDRWEWFLDMIGHEYVEMPQVRKTTNRKRQREVLSWNTLYDWDPELTEKILKLAESFGYEQIPTHYLDDPFYQFPETLRLRNDHMGSGAKVKYSLLVGERG